MVKRSEKETMLKPFAKFIVDYIENNDIHDRLGWVNHFQGYAYAGQKAYNCFWKKVLGQKFMLHMELDRALKSNQREKISKVFDIIINNWGGIKSRLNEIDEAKVLESIRYLNSLRDPPGDAIESKRVYTWRIASISKIYFFFNPNYWTIYDSRVATALQWLGYLYSIKNELSEKLKFVAPPSQSKGRKCPKGFQTLNQIESDQYILACWLLQMVAEELNCDRRGVLRSLQNIVGYPIFWSLYHVEMVLFIIGEKAPQGWILPER